MEKLKNIQKKLKAPKGQKNTFGKYNYRSCEDILEAVKPLLEGATLTLTDEIVVLGGSVDQRFYVKSTATIKDGKEEAFATAYAREQETKKGMDSAQITGAASSYARKYALNGLFLIDDTKDADTMDNSSEGQKQAKTTPKKDPMKQIEMAIEQENDPGKLGDLNKKVQESKLYTDVQKAKVEGLVNAKVDKVLFSE